eukprot:COSAG02_NODE_3037_length_7501_cov_5.769116_2_plen_425_part_00
MQTEHPVMAASVRWSDPPPEKGTDTRPSYPFRSSGGKFNQSKGPRLFSSVSPTLGHQEATGSPLAEGDATYDSHTPSYNDAMNMSSQINIDMSKYWTRESASTVKRWDAEVGRHARRASPVKYNPHLIDSRKDVPMGVMPRPGAGAGIDLAGQRLPNRWELEFDPVAAQVPEPEPEKELPDEAPGAISTEALDGAASPELQAYLTSKGGSSPATAAQGSPGPSSSASPAVSFDPAAVAKAKDSLDQVPEPSQQNLAIAMTAQATMADSKTSKNGRIVHGRRRGSPTRHRSTKPGGGGSYGVITGAVHQSRGVQRQALQEQTVRRPLGNEARSGHYKDRRAANFGGQGKQGSAWAAQTGVDRFGRPKTIRGKVEEELLAGPNALSPTRLSPTRRGKAPVTSSTAPAASTRRALPGAVPPVVVHKA